MGKCKYMPSGLCKCSKCTLLLQGGSFISIFLICPCMSVVMELSSNLPSQHACIKEVCNVLQSMHVCHGAFRKT